MLELPPSKLAVKTMVLLEVSIIDIALLAAITVLIILYVTLLLRLKPSTETTISRQPERESQPKLPIEEQERPERPVAPVEKPEPTISVEIPETQEEPPEHIETSTPTTEEAMKPTKTPKRTKETPPECPHYFGYLKKLPKNLPIPDECLGCLRIMECLHSSPISE